MFRNSSINKRDLLKVLQNYLPTNIENFTFSVEQNSVNQNVLHVKILSENQSVYKEYVLLKVLADANLLENRKEAGSFSTLNEVFILKNEQKETYFGFEKNEFWLPSINNEEHLKVILKAIAEFQAKHFNSSVKSVEHEIKSVVEKVVSSNLFETLDNINNGEVSQTVQKSLDEFYINGLVVKSVATVFANNVYLKNSRECVFLELEDDKLRSPLFDALMFIFTFSDSNKFRQHNLLKLLKFYHQCLVDCLHKNNGATRFDKIIFKKHVKAMLEIVKYELASHFLTTDCIESKEKTVNLFQNIALCLRYPILNYEECLEAVSNKLQSTDFDLLEYKLVPLQERNGFLGDYFFLKAKVNQETQIEELSMFVKVLRENIEILSTKEQTFFYGIYMPLLNTYGLGSIMDFVPKCYFDRFSEVIALEDLSELGFKPFKPSTRLTYDIIKIVFKNCAKFHASTLLLEERMSEKKGYPVRLGDLYGEFLGDILYTDCGDHFWSLMPSRTKRGVEECIRTFQDIPKNISKEDFQKKVDKLIDGMPQMVVTSKEFRNTICHSDTYPGNILAAFDGSGTAVKGALVDFQVVRYGPPVFDILFHLYVSTSKDVRDKYKDILLDEYYDELKSIMVQYGADINSIYSPEKYKDCIKTFESTAIVGALMHSPFTAPCKGAEVDNIMKDPYWQYDLAHNRNKFVNYKLTNSKEFSDCIRDLVVDLYESLY